MTALIHVYDSVYLGQIETKLNISKYIVQLLPKKPPLKVLLLLTAIVVLENLTMQRKLHTNNLDTVVIVYCI